MKKGISLILILGMMLCGCSQGQNQTSSKAEVSVQSEVSEESEVSKEESKLPEPESRDVFAMGNDVVRVFARSKSDFKQGGNFRAVGSK